MAMLGGCRRRTRLLQEVSHIFAVHLVLKKGRLQTVRLVCLLRLEWLWANDDFTGSCLSERQVNVSARAWTSGAVPLASELSVRSFDS